MSWYPSHSPVPLANDNIGLTLSVFSLSRLSFFLSLLALLFGCSLGARGAWRGGGGVLCVCVCVLGGGGLPNHAVNSRLYGSFSNDDDDMKLPISTFF